MKVLKLISIVGVVVMTAVSCSGNLSTSIWAPRPGSNLQAIGAIGLPDGVFSGVGTGGFHGDVSVEVTIKDDAIVDITITAHNETPEIGGTAFGHIIKTVMQRQSTGIDAVAGASRTSQALINAIEDALVSGGAELAVIRAGGATPEVAAEPAKVYTIGSEPSAHGPFFPGTYEGFAEGGFNGAITLEVTFSETHITAIEITESDETPMIAGPAFDVLIPSVLLNQTYELDTVSGATYASRTFLAAVQDAVEQAQ
jgi:uncharacterized protein with FMN-binding domain